MGTILVLPLLIAFYAPLQHRAAVLFREPSPGLHLVVALTLDDLANAVNIRRYPAAANVWLNASSACINTAFRFETQRRWVAIRRQRERGDEKKLREALKNLERERGRRQQNFRFIPLAPPPQPNPDPV